MGYFQCRQMQEKFASLKKASSSQMVKSADNKTLSNEQFELETLKIFQNALERLEDYEMQFTKRADKH